MTTSPEVDRWMAAYDNPQKSLVQAVREVILAADPRVSECIKWQAPTFTYKGNIASFFPKAKAHASLMFHKGATIPGTFAILEGDGPEGRSLKIRDAGDLAAKRGELEAIISAWCDLQDRA
jgi:uncharacterized protein YdhG (YjbR/CyaY superfamily)